MITRLYHKPMFSDPELDRLRPLDLASVNLEPEQIVSQWCYYIETDQQLEPEEISRLKEIISDAPSLADVSTDSFILEPAGELTLGPQLRFATPWSTTARTIFENCGIRSIKRVERFRHYGFSVKLPRNKRKALADRLHDRMTEQVYDRALENMESLKKPEPVRRIPLRRKGTEILKHYNAKLGWAMDEDDIEYFYHLFVDELKRDPTTCEAAQFAGLNSEHTRHGRWTGTQHLEGKTLPDSLMDTAKAAWQANPGNSVIAFHDDSSAIQGPRLISALNPLNPGKPSPITLSTVLLHLTLTAETHNFPSGVAPFPGAATGTGGRIRDNISVGRGGYMRAAGAGYCVGNLHIPCYEQPWEVYDKLGWRHPDNLASPLDILIQASNGASDYGNAIGEPVIYGICRAFGLPMHDGYWSWFKPIMYTVGAGFIDDRHTVKGKPKPGMLVVQIGGPAYRIGMGGGPASSMIQGANKANLDYDAVQRGDPEMEQRVWRVIKACIELGDDNPVVTIHDLGAGGDCNALPEIVEPQGARIFLRAIPVGDKSLSVLEILVNESQEREVFLIWPDSLALIESICERENCLFAVIGEITGDGQFVLEDNLTGTTPVTFPLDKFLGKRPRKHYDLKRIPRPLANLSIPNNLTVRQALENVLRLPSVCSKAFLTRKVDRSVTGLVAQQQCVGPHHLPIADFAVLAQSHFDITGAALSLGEQPLKGMISTPAMGRLAFAEALLNMAGAKITNLGDIRYSGNWMWAVKEPGEGIRVHDCASALRDISVALGPAQDGGKDSSAMATKVVGPDYREHIVKSPGELVIAMYAPMNDIRKKVTPVLEPFRQLYWIDLSPNKKRLGGSALAHSLGQIGDNCPDIDNAKLLERTFFAVQRLVNDNIITAIHDISDGGLIVTLLEMAFAGNVGFGIGTCNSHSTLATFFAEEPGLVIACHRDKVSELEYRLKIHGVPCQHIGESNFPDEHRVLIRHNGETIIDDSMLSLRAIWEETSTRLDELQTNPERVAEEAKVLSELAWSPCYKTYFNITAPKSPKLPCRDRSGRFRAHPKAAILRDEGSNGDAEMAAAFLLAGFEPWDITMSDLVAGRITLDRFQVLVFVGGFSYRDVLGASKGWRAVIKFNPQVAEQFERFYRRPDTLSLGVCNGCQLMALLGWVPFGPDSDKRVRFIRNSSQRFESRFPVVKVRANNPAVMMKDMDGSVLGVWVAHGEGQLYTNYNLIQEIIDNHLDPLRFSDFAGAPTETYPFNPNGSPYGITALCSPDGRHLAMMPHPERTFLLWQWPWLPKDWDNLPASPWLKMFQNAFEWCLEHQDTTT